MDAALHRNIQKLQMVIMDEIHRVCVANQLRYYLIGGSALGAVRHKGFIPWDPDIDIAMPRKDYELFIKHYSKQLNPLFSCHSHYSDSIYYPPHALVVLNDSVLDDGSIMMKSALRPIGIYVDVLPLDSWPLDEKQKMKQQNLLKIIKIIKYRKAGISYTSNSIFTKVLKCLISVFLSVFSWKFLNSIQQNVMMKYDYQESSNWCSMASHYSFEKLTMDKSIFGTPILMKFEDREYFVPERVIEYLTHLFGDYMKLPPIESQEELRNMFISATWPKGVI